MELYFINIKAKGFRGKPRTTLPKVLNDDLKANYNKDPYTAELLSPGKAQHQRRSGMIENTGPK
eukprot:gene17340-8920_t